MPCRALSHRLRIKEINAHGVRNKNRVIRNLCHLCYALFLIQASLAVYVLQGITDTAGFNLNEKQHTK